MTLWRRCSVALVLVAACGPKVGGDEDATSGEGTGDSQAEVGTSTSGVITTAPPNPTTPPPGVTSDGSAMVTSEAEATSLPDGSTGVDGTTGFSCGCPESQPIGFDDPVEEGFSAADLVAALDGTQLSWTWTGVAGDPGTVLHVELMYEGGQVLAGPGGDDGCAFLSIPCPDGVTLPLSVVLTSDDGMIVDSFPATLEGVLGESAQMGTEPVLVSDLQGTLPAQAIENGRGEPVELTEVYAGVAWDWPRDMQTLYVTGGLYGITAPLEPSIEVGWGEQL